MSWIFQEGVSIMVLTYYVRGISEATTPQKYKIISHSIKIMIFTCKRINLKAVLFARKNLIKDFIETDYINAFRAVRIGR